MIIVCFSPAGKKFRSRTELAGFFAAEGTADMKAVDFDFSVRGIHQGAALSTKTSAKKSAGKPNRGKETTPVAATLAQKLVIKMSFPSRSSSKNNSDDEDVAKTGAGGNRNSAAAEKATPKGGRGKGSAKKGKKKQEDGDTEPLKVPRKRGRPPKPKPVSEPEAEEDISSDLSTNTPSKRGRKREMPGESECEEEPVDEKPVKSPARKGRIQETPPESEAMEQPVKSPTKRGRKPKVIVPEVEGPVLESVDPTDMQQGEEIPKTSNINVDIGENRTTVEAAVCQPARRGRGRPKKVKATDPVTTESPDVVEVSEGNMATDSTPAVQDESVATPKRRGWKRSVTTPATETVDQLESVSVEPTEMTDTTPRRRSRKQTMVASESYTDATSITVATPKRRGRKRLLALETEAAQSMPSAVAANESSVAQDVEGEKFGTVVSESETTSAPSDGSMDVSMGAMPSHQGRRRATAAVQSENVLPQVAEDTPVELGPRVRRKSWRLSDSLYDSGDARPRSTHRKNSSNRNKTTAAKTVTVASVHQTISAEPSELYTMLKLPSGNSTTGDNSAAVQMDMITDKLTLTSEKSVLVKASDLHELSNIEHIPKLPPSNILSDFSSNWEFLDNSDVPPAVASTSQMDLGARDDVECYSTDLMIPSEHGEPNADISVDVKSPVQLDHSYYCVNPRMQKVGKGKSPPISVTLTEKLPKLTTTSPAGKRTKTSLERKMGQSPKRVDDTSGGGDFIKTLPVVTSATSVTISDFFMSSSGDSSVQPQQSDVATTASGEDQQKVADIGAGSSLGRTSVDAGAYIVYV